jgi:MoxR-like ATPase
MDGKPQLSVRFTMSHSLSSVLNSVNLLTTELRRFIVGQDLLIERLIVALLAQGHVLLEGVPGLAKTRTLSVLTRCLSVQMGRIQFTPDLLPSDLIGTEVYRPQTGEFVTRKGPLFTNLLLADEINRAPAKVQSALLQAMQERCVTIGEETYPLPSPFVVLATQNPIEQEGTYRLPEAQLDRFLMKIIVSYPSFDEELEILRMVTEEDEGAPPNAVISPEQLAEMQRGARAVHSDPRIDAYIVSLVHATRRGDAHGLGGMIDWGASPRAGIALKSCAKSLAYVRGRAFVTPDDVIDLAPDVLRHRVLPSFEAEAQGISADDIVRQILRSVSTP